MRLNRLFLLLVVAPTALAVLYFGFLAHDVYVSESQFVVRTVQRQMPSGLGSLLQGSGLTQGSSDVYSVQSYLTSRDALQTLEQRYHLKRSFGSPRIDAVARFNPLGWDDSFENLLRYYQKFIINTDLDSTSSILTLTVRAFSAEEAHAINEDLLKMSEDFVNQLNERARQDLVRFATADVDTAQKQQRTAVAARSRYRNDHSLYDPGKQADLQRQEVGALQAGLINTRKQDEPAALHRAHRPTEPAGCRDRAQSAAERGCNAAAEPDRLGSDLSAGRRRQGARRLMDRTAPQPDFLRSLAIQTRVIGALVMREIITRYGRHNIGFMWVFVEPMMFTTGVLGVWSLVHTHASKLPLVP